MSQIIKVKNTCELVEKLLDRSDRQIWTGAISLRVENLSFYIHNLHQDPHVFVIWVGKPLRFSFSTFRYRVFIGDEYDLKREIESVLYVAKRPGCYFALSDFCKTLDNTFPIVEKGNLCDLVVAIDYWIEKGRVVGAAYSVSANSYHYFIHNLHDDSQCFLVWRGLGNTFSFKSFTPYFFAGNAEQLGKFILKLDDDVPF